MVYSEQLRDGRALLFALNHRIQSGDRFRSAEDEVAWTTFEPRGFRYLTCTVRGAAGDVTLRALKGYASIVPLRDDARFACSDPVLTKVWDLCKRGPSASSWRTSTAPTPTASAACTAATR